MVSQSQHVICKFVMKIHRRRHRRLFHQTFRAETVKIFHSQQLKAAHQLVLRLANSHDALHQIKQYVSLPLYIQP